MVNSGPEKPPDVALHARELRATAIPGRPASEPAGIPVFAFGAGLTALGVLRSLHASGVPVYSVCPPDDLAAKSRWYRPAPLMSGTIPQPSQLCEYLAGLKIDRAVLFPCSDDWVRALAELPASLKERFPASVPDAGVADTMTDKWRFSTLLECLDVPRPRTIRVTSMEELYALDEAAYEDMFLKPVDSQEFARRNRVKAFRLEGKRHALEIMEGVLANGGSGFPILLQEYIPGPPTTYFLVDGFVDRHGEPRAWIARRRLSQYPKYFGNSARSRTIPLAEVRGAVNTLERMWSKTGYRGIFDAEFKFDARDRQLKILEVNARPWWFVEFATRCGMDLCRMAYQDALGLPFEASTNYDVGRTCVYLSYDLAAHLGNDGGLGGILRWARSFWGVEDIIYRWDDPGPGLHSTLAALRNYRRHRREKSQREAVHASPPPGNVKKNVAPWPGVD